MGKDVTKTKDQLPARTSGEGGTPAGFDNFDKDDYKMPRLAILQAMSEIVTDGKGSMGEIANSVTKEVYGNSVEFIPLYGFKSRAQFEVGRGLLMMSLDNKTVTFGIDEFEKYIGVAVDQVPGTEWEGKEPPIFGLIYNFPCLLSGDGMVQFPLCLSLMKTATKCAKDFISMTRYANEDMFARVYAIKTSIVNGDKGTYAVPSIEFVRRCTDDEYTTGRKWFTELYKKSIEVDLAEEPLADENLQEKETKEEKFEE